MVGGIPLEVHAATAQSIIIPQVTENSACITLKNLQQYMHLLYPFEVFLKFVPGADLGYRLGFVDF